MQGIPLFQAGHSDAFFIYLFSALLFSPDAKAPAEEARVIEKDSNGDGIFKGDLKVELTIQFELT